MVAGALQTLCGGGSCTLRPHGSPGSPAVFFHVNSHGRGARHPNDGSLSTKARQLVGLPQFQERPLREASLWAKVFRRSVAERARLPQGMATQGALCTRAVRSPRGLAFHKGRPRRGALCMSAIRSPRGLASRKGRPRPGADKREQAPARHKRFCRAEKAARWFPIQRPCRASCNAASSSATRRRSASTSSTGAADSGPIAVCNQFSQESMPSPVRAET